MQSSMGPTNEFVASIDDSKTYFHTIALNPPIQNIDSRYVDHAIPSNTFS
jgi:hypothetical protein